MDKKKSSYKSLIWVYPPNNWGSTSNKTFVYGYSDPRAQLFISVGVRRGTPLHIPAHKIHVYPNGNFAQTIRLPHKKNIVRLVQILHGKKKIINRNVNVKSVGADLCVCPNVKQGEHIGSPLQKTRNVVIVIDPGHGGKEHGTHSPRGIAEKHFNLQVAKMLVEALYAMHLRGKIYLTRTKDKFVSLKERVNFAKKKKCNILISIHHNALPDGEDPLKHNGIGIYYTHDFVKPLAKALLVSISKTSGLKKYGVFKRNFALTKPSWCHAVLIECGFLTHPLESEIVTKKEMQEKIVSGIMKVLINF